MMPLLGLACCPRWGAGSACRESVLGALSSLGPSWRGLPQGDPMSVVMANIFFAALCRRLEERATCLGLWTHVSSYMDDMSVLVADFAHIAPLLHEVNAFFGPLGVVLNMGKCRMFTTCGETHARWLADPSVLPFPPTACLKLLGTEVWIHGKCKFEHSSYSGKLRAALRRLQRVAVVPGPRSLRSLLVSSGVSGVVCGDVGSCYQLTAFGKAVHDWTCIFLLRNLRLELSVDGFAYVQDCHPVQVLAPPDCPGEWQHSMRELLRVSQLSLLAKRRPAFDGVEHGIDRKVNLQVFDSLQDVCARCILEHHLCGGLVPIGEFGDFRLEGSHLCPLCEQADLSTEHLLWTCVRFRHLRYVQLSEIEAYPACFRFHGIVPSGGHIPSELVASVHKQVIDIWLHKLSLERDMHHRGCVVRPRKQKGLEIIADSMPPFADGQPDIQCTPCLYTSCWIKKSRFGRIPCTPRARGVRLSVPCDIVRTGEDFTVPAARSLPIGEHRVQIADGHRILQHGRAGSVTLSECFDSLAVGACDDVNVVGTSSVKVARLARMAVPANIIRTGVDFSIPAPAALQVGDHELQIVNGHEQLQCLP
eukprot:238026-Amphidinium_carterae.1